MNAVVARGLADAMLLAGLVLVWAGFGFWWALVAGVVTVAARWVVGRWVR